jgi:hypothetical protein
MNLFDYCSLALCDLAAAQQKLLAAKRLLEREGVPADATGHSAVIRDVEQLRALQEELQTTITLIA